MPRIKKHRLGIRIDMTPMVDVATLLVLFFMLTASFKPPEAVSITLPTSDKGPPVPGSGVMTISVDKGGQIWMGFDQQQIMKLLFEKAYPNGIPDKEGKLIPVWLMPAVPVQEKDLASLVVEARLQNIRLITVIKADKDTDYGPVMDVMNDLQKAQVTRFNLQTELKESGGQNG
ncbi:MAG TPA: biopolymer transporter ExbD [Candidatus Acidoferrales bacterium]|nr:biopolymer transporter ExbD [Candidatus Acidoferrales bacterium]